jgi:hypothetical protein
MNILDIQDKLKGLSQDQLAQEMQMPTGAVPQFLVLGEMNRRQSMRQSMQQQGAGAQTVAQELLNGAGVPSEGMSDMGRSMAPKSSIAQNTGIGSLPQQAPPSQQAGIESLAATGMYAGGRVTKMAGGSNGAIDRNSYTLPQIIGGGLSDLSDWWNSGPTYAPRLNPRDPLVEIDPKTGEPIQQQSPVDPREANAITAPVAPVTAPAADPFAAPQTTTTSPSGSGSSGASSGKMSTYEQMLADAMANAEKKAKQDKWLALAQAGMALMSSTSGSFAGALGEAGKVGIEALQSARDTGTATQLELAKQQFLIDEDRNARARSAASAGRPKPRTASGILSEISSINEILSNLTQEDATGMPIPPDDATLATMAQLAAQRDALIGEYGQIQNSGADLSDVPQ